MTGARVFLGNIEAFSEAKVVVQRGFVFSTEGVQNFWVFPIDLEMALLFVGDDARVAPFFGFEGSAMFLHTGFNLSLRFSDIFFATRAR